MRAAQASKRQATFRSPRAGLTMSDPSQQQPPSDDGIPIGRLAVWAVLAAVLAFGIYLFFRFGRDMSPLLG